MTDCIFCKIINKEIPAQIVYEDDEIISFKDINPVAPVHVLIVPKKHITKLTDLKKEDEAVIGKIYSVINILAKEHAIDEQGFRVIINCRRRWGTSRKSYTFSFNWWEKIGSKNSKLKCVQSPNNML